MTYNLKDRQNLEKVLKLVTALTKTGDKIVSRLEDVAMATMAIESEVKVAADALHELASQNDDPQLSEIATRLTVAHDALKAAVDEVMASGGGT